MKTTITIEVEHSKSIPHLADMIAGRAWSIDGVTKAEPAQRSHDIDLQGFTGAELALGRQEVVRG